MKKISNLLHEELTIITEIRLIDNQLSYLTDTKTMRNGLQQGSNALYMELVKWEMLYSSTLA